MYLLEGTMQPEVGTDIGEELVHRRHRGSAKETTKPSCPATKRPAGAHSRFSAAVGCLWEENMRSMEERTSSNLGRHNRWLGGSSEITDQLGCFPD